jgi:hypothetical protein
VLDDLRRDLRVALRQIWSRPGFASIVVVTLGLGIGSMTAVFSSPWRIRIECAFGEMHTAATTHLDEEQHANLSRCRESSPP